MEAIKTPFMDWSVAALPLAGQERSGDAYAVKAWDKKIMIAVVDGLGHGEQAANAALIAVDTLIKYAPEMDNVIPLVRQCHEALLRSRGVVLSIALFDTENNTMTWMGIGNVDGFLFHADPQANPDRVSIVLRGGVVGYQLPSLRSSTIHVTRGDLLIFFTDGIRSGFEKDVNPGDPPQRIADMIIMNYIRKTDDALVLVARYIGGLL
ncbi:MAG: Phosphoserine phosphatase RsbX [Syntrophus sp. SKADARSKE-3]|nr:Phosphoserine phosphatase RsbX [Syntrophus sp. SKADARSKE-3]